MSNECTVSSDCTLANGVLRECYESNNYKDEVFFCECANYYGWSGENCDKETSFVYWERSFAIIIAFVRVLFILLPTSKSLFLYFRFRWKQTDLPAIKKKNAAVIAGILVWLNSVTLIIYFGSRVPSQYNSSKFKLDQFAGRESVQRNLHELEFFTLLLASYFQLFAAIHIMMSWLALIIEVSRTFPGEPKWVSERSLQIIIKTTAVIVAITFILLFLTADLVIVFGFYIVGSFIAAVSFGIVYFRFRNFTVKVLNLADSKIMKELRLITTTFRVNVACFSLILVFVFVFVIFNNFQQSLIPIGGFNYTQLWADAAGLTAAIAMIYTSYYVHRVTSNLIGKRNEIAWLVGFDWTKRKEKEVKKYPIIFGNVEDAL